MLKGTLSFPLDHWMPGILYAYEAVCDQNPRAPRSERAAYITAENWIADLLSSNHGYIAYPKSGPSHSHHGIFGTIMREIGLDTALLSTVHYAIIDAHVDYTETLNIEILNRRTLRILIY